MIEFFQVKPQHRFIDLHQGAKLALFPDYVETLFEDGYIASAHREFNDVNIAQAIEQGYAATKEGLYASLAEHEALHTIVARWLYSDRNSLVLLQSAGCEVYLPHWKQLHEESVVLGLQVYLNTHECVKSVDQWLTYAPKGTTLVMGAEYIRKILDLVPLL